MINRIFKFIIIFFKKNKHKFHIYTNKDRADRIKRMLGLCGEDDDKEYYRVADVICDLRHYCNYYKVDFEGEEVTWDNEMRVADLHYNREIVEDVE